MPDEAGSAGGSMWTFAGLRWLLELVRAPSVYLMTVAMCFAPKTTSVALGIAFCAGVITLAPGYGVLRNFIRSSSAVWLAAGFLSFALLASLWSFSPEEGFRVVSYEILVLLGLVFAAADVAKLEEPGRSRVGRAAAYAIITAATCLLIDLSSGHMLTRWLYGLWPDLIAGNNQQLFVERNGTLSVVSTLLNQHTKPLTLLVWPAALLAYLSFSGRLRLIVPIAMLVLTAATLLLSESETAKLAFVGAGAAGLMAYWLRRTTLVLALAAWTLVSLLIVPAVFALSSAQLHKASWLQPSARQRVAMWDRFANKILERPIFGAGPRSLRYEEFARFEAARAKRMAEMGPIKPKELGLPLDKNGQVARVKNLNGEDFKPLRPLKPLPPLSALPPPAPSKSANEDTLQRRAAVEEWRQARESAWQERKANWDRRFAKRQLHAEQVHRKQQQVLAKRRSSAERLERLIERRMQRAELKRLRDIPLAQPHAHNIYVETWYELGLIGSLLMTATGIALLFGIWKTEGMFRAAGAAAFAAAALISVASHGLWQPWLHSGMAWVVAFLVLAAGIVRPAAGRSG